jgi:scyllo-inositol 2-dehydrogenase (NADP+)
MTLSAGLAGFGLAGRYFHLPLLQAAGINIAAVVTSRVEAVRETLPSAAVLQAFEPLLEREDIDLIVIATPTGLHASQAAAALHAGKHVVVDKPLSVTSAEARTLARVASAQDRKLAVFQNRRWDSDFLTIRRLIDEQQLGEINAFHARWDRFRPAITDRWRERAEPGSGMLYDLGSHLIDQALQLFGRPDWIQADVFTQRAGAVADDGFEILMGKGVLRISLGVSSMAAGGDWRYRIHGSRAAFFKGGLDPQEDQLRSGMKPDANDFGIEPAAQWGKLVAGADGQARTIEPERGRWRLFYEGLRNSIERGTAVPVAAAEASITLEIIEQARRSALEGRRIALS